MSRRVSLVLVAAALAVIALPRALSAYGAGRSAATADATAAQARRPLLGAVHDGVWIWTRADADIFTKHGGLAKDATPGVLVLSIEADAHGPLRGRRGLSPSSAGTAAVAAVVRIEDSVTPRLADPPQLQAELEARLEALRGEIEATGTKLAELQLDFDVPVSRLDAWAQIAGGVAKGSLADVPVWVTSIPAHVADARYGALFSGKVAGHVYQVFDTGLACDARSVAKARAELERAGVPFRVGVATFERERVGRQTTEHTCWVNATHELRRASGYAGAWVFPAGRSVDTALSILESER